MTRRAAAAIALGLLLAACGRVGPPVRSQPAPAAPATAGAESGEDRESEQEEP